MSDVKFDAAQCARGMGLSESGSFGVISKVVRLVGSRFVRGRGYKLDWEQALDAAVLDASGV
jgi:hypothetical protein